MQKFGDKLNSIIKLFNNGEKQKALSEINLLLANNSKNIDLLLLHAKICINLNEINKANSSLIELLNLNSKNYEALKLIYVNYLQVGKYDLANKYINELLLIEDTNYEILRDKSYIEYLNKNYSDSEKFIKKALKINNEEVFGLNILGLLSLEKGKAINAVELFEKAISIDPQYTDSYNNLGKCYIDLEKLNLAFLNFKKAYKINPLSDLPIINIANILSLKDKNKLAIKFYEKAKKINPDNKQADENIIICNMRQKNFDWVEKKFLALRNSNELNNDITLGYSYLLLNKKKFQEGFSYFDARLKTKEFPKKNIYHFNVLKSLNKKKNLIQDDNILIVKEQGVGDEILFSSMYNDLINNNFNNVKIECDPRLIEIFKRSFKNINFFNFGHFSSSIKKISQFDNVFYSGSLTKYFRQNELDFNSKPYLKTIRKLDDKFKLYLNEFKNRKRIGISWKSVVNIYGSLKSLKLYDFKELLSNERVFFNLQYGDTHNEINHFNKNGNVINNFDNIDFFNDFESLISILKNLDLFVTVSNSTAHFAGALGVPTILICPKKSSTFYYWDYEDGKTPWYNCITVVKYKKSTEYTMSLVNELINKMS